MTEEENQETITETKTPPTAEEELQEYKEKYLRLLADLDNTRKRMMKERQEMSRFAVENFIVDVLSPIDNLENALQFTQHMSDETRNWAQGFTMILGQFKDVLSDHGITAIDSSGAKFDPEVHYAIETEETTEKLPGTVLKEFVKGYRSKERTIRHARVKVSVQPGTNKQENEAEPQEALEETKGE